jgi:hypothetical protein
MCRTHVNEFVPIEDLIQLFAGRRDRELMEHLLDRKLSEEEWVAIGYDDALYWCCVHGVLSQSTMLQEVYGLLCPFMEESRPNDWEAVLRRSEKDVADWMHNPQKSTSIALHPVNCETRFPQLATASQQERPIHITSEELECP